MNLLDRYIFKGVLFTCMAAVALLAFVVALPNLLRDLMAPFLAGQLSLGAFGWLVFLLFPYALTFALPAGLLTGALLTLGRLSAGSEITAMRAAGISLARVARPVFLFGAACLALEMYVNFQLMPWARTEYHRFLADALRQNPTSFIVPKTFIRNFSNCVIYVGARDGQVMQDIWIWKLDADRKVTDFIRAESGRLDYDEATNSYTPVLTNAKIERRTPGLPEDFSKSPYVPAAGIAGDPDVHFSMDRFFGREEVHIKPEWLTYPQLQAKRRELAALPVPADPDKARDAVRERMKLELVISDKYNLAIATFAFAFIAVPLGIRVSRRETSANFGVAVLLVLGYYLMTQSIKSLDRHPEYRPDLLLWLPNLVFIGLGMRLLRRLEQ